MNEQHKPANWRTAAQQRRIVFFSGVALLTGLATLWLGNNLPVALALVWKLLVLLPFSILFFWLALGFITATAGFWVLVRGDQYRITSAPDTPLPTLQTPETTAILLPIYNEDIAYVYAGLKSIYESLEKTGNLAFFEFYILSDTDDASDWLREEAAWSTLCGIWAIPIAFITAAVNTVLKRKAGM